MEMDVNASDVYRRTTQAFNAGDRAALEELIAEDVIWHTDDHQATVPSEFRGRDAFFEAAATPNDRISAWEVVPYAVLSEGSTAFCHQIDRFVLQDGTNLEIHFLLHITLNEEGQIKEVWEFGQSALPH
jgi:ketosteroid isomerase-like protein